LISNIRIKLPINFLGLGTNLIAYVRPDSSIDLKAGIDGIKDTQMFRNLENMAIGYALI